MLKSDALSSAEYDPEAWKYFSDLKKQNKLDWFLDLEHRFPSATALQPGTVNVIFGALRRHLIS